MAAGDPLDVVLPGDLERRGPLAAGGGALLVDGEHGVDLPRHALLPGEPPVVALPERVDRLAAGTVDGPGAQVQEPQPHVEHRAGPALEQHLGARAVGLVGEAGRGEHPELPAQPVLLRRGAVGVEQVALEQHGVGDRGDLVERGVHGRASFSSRSTVSSHVGSTRSDR